MNIQLTKHIHGNLQIEDSLLSGVFGPKQLNSSGLSDSDIRHSINNPYGTGPLRTLVKSDDSVLIVTDDNTRLTPLRRLLPSILDELHAAGVKKENITFLIGLGTHRAMTEEEITDKFGRQIADEYKIYNHAWNDPLSLISLGSCELGFEVVINRLVKEADFIMSVGSIVPHATCGFSGGGKTIMPGICGEKTIEETHWTALHFTMSEILGNHHNPVRNSITRVCRDINLGFIVNTILFNGDSIYGVVAGDVEEAHEKGVHICREIYGEYIPETADIVVAEAFPTDIDLRQAIKAVCSADLVCRNDGIIILPAECPEGMAPQFPSFSEYGFKDPDKLFKDVEDGVFSQKLMAYTLVAIGRIISKRVRAILVSPNISAEEAAGAGFLWAPDLQSAVDKAFELTGKDAKVIVLKQAGELLPVLQECS